MSVRIQNQLKWLFLLLLVAVLTSCDNSSGGSGVNAAPGISDRLNVATVHYGQVVSVTASCLKGEQMLSGGWALTTPNYRSQIPLTVGRPGPNDVEKYFVAGSFPSSSSSWTVIFTNEATDDQANILGTVHVECLTIGVTPTIVSQAETDTSSYGVAVACPGGDVLTGGGYELTNLNADHLDAQLIDFRSARPITTALWSVSTDFSLGSIRADGDNNGIEAFGVCTKNISTSLGATVTVSAPGGPNNAATFGSSSAFCPKSELVIGAGYNKAGNLGGTFPLTLFYPDYGNVTPEWSVQAYALPAVGYEGSDNIGGSATITPICATIGQ